MGKSFKENLKEMLEYKDMTVKELAYLSGISDRSIGNYLNARESMPPADYACKIAKVLGTTVEYLVTGQDATIPETKFSKQLKKIIINYNVLTAEDKDLLLSLSNSLSEKK